MTQKSARNDGIYRSVVISESPPHSLQDASMALTESKILFSGFRFFRAFAFYFPRLSLIPDLSGLLLSFRIK